MGEIWPKKKSAGRRSIIEGTVLGEALVDVVLQLLTNMTIKSN